MKHNEEVTDYAIDNKVSFKDAYCSVIDKKLQAVENGLSDLKNEVIELREQLTK